MRARKRLMPGTPISRSREEMLDDLGIDEVIDLYVEHGTVRELVRPLFTPRNDGETPFVRDLYAWPRADDRRAWATWQDAKRLRGLLEGDEAVLVARSATPKDVRVAKLQSDVYRWRAGILNRETFYERECQERAPPRLDAKRRYAWHSAPWLDWRVCQRAMCWMSRSFYRA